MKNEYVDLVGQTYHLPRDEFTLDGGELRFHNIDLMELVRQYGAPLKLVYLPKISENVQRVKKWFKKVIKKHKYRGEYNYCYCTKSSHFKHVIAGALEGDIHMGTFSAFGIDTINNLIGEELINKESHILCNGFKRDAYIDGIADLINREYYNYVPIIDNYEEINLLEEKIKDRHSIGIRIASEGDPRSEFYTNHLDVGYKSILPFYNREIRDDPRVRLKTLHFFINIGIEDNVHYQNELLKCLYVYIQLKKVAPGLDSLNTGGGFSIESPLASEYDYAYIIDEIICQMKITYDQEEVPVPNIFTEFGSFTIGETGGAIYETMYQK